MASSPHSGGGAGGGAGASAGVTAPAATTSAAAPASSGDGGAAAGNSADKARSAYQIFAQKFYQVVRDELSASGDDFQLGQVSKEVAARVRLWLLRHTPPAEPCRKVWLLCGF